ncbi:hypothetical protein ARALYDRAFT_472497 [Arabidopsis lyrata subsp. lyrata]|uniref:Uncharacterized protein n=1 Tax=Arabidopsis lyrata subsp. lyrata TaxID=81972 RepID=D7KLT3_ARALL|nr:uncharacterized protein LOC9329301 isoform X2 [Arabidopsis lyrata subsp. lyrata]EFH66779.1 hypothetical protein ARALYDRAFT_472497 [Arabidopsis lyrata subsp. lyrata]|eukprot:XP_020866576.1 uncharacterized protein LOC9329301 isoform X2 [Arabidopsis lyrata subsp. lyrata]
MAPKRWFKTNKSTKSVRIACRCLRSPLVRRLSELPVEKQTKYMMDQKDLMNKMIQDAKKKLEKEKMHTRAMKLGLMAASNDLITDTDCSEELAKAADVVDKKHKAIIERIKAVKAGAPILKRE